MSTNRARAFQEPHGLSQRLDRHSQPAAIRDRVVATAHPEPSRASPSRIRSLRQERGERMFVTRWRFYELESLRRILAMLPAKAPTLEREKATALIAELKDAEQRLKRLRDGLAKLLDEDHVRPL